VKLLVTGASGFLGSHLIRAFLTDGHDVVALKRSTSDLRRLADISAELAFYDIDSCGASTPFIEQGGIEAIVHTATCYGRHGEAAAEVFQANTAFPLRLLEAATHYNVNTFFNTDTFFNTGAIRYAYLNAYSVSKMHFADWGRLFAAKREIQFVNIRLEHLYGAGDAPAKFTSWIVRECLSNVPEIALTPGEQRRDFIYVDDVVAAYRSLLNLPKDADQDTQEVGLGSGRPVTLRSFVEAVHRLTGSTARLRFGALPYRENELMESKADTRTLNALGWHCTIEIEEGIARMVDAARADHAR
jgi:CDP-paratose synthetase